MRIRIKLTVLCDSDLLALRNHPEFDFKGWFRDVVHTYVHTGEVLKIPLPSKPDDIELRSTMLSVTFHEQNEPDVINWLKSFKPRLRSGGIKSLLRCSLENPCLYDYFNDSEISTEKIDKTEKAPEYIYLNHNQPSTDSKSRKKSPKKPKKKYKESTVSFSMKRKIRYN